MKCPGQDMQYWKPGAIYDAKCPQCGQSVEFFKDDTTRTCGHCGHRFANPKLDFGCAAYCQFAEQCLGTLPAEAVAQQQDLLKDRVAVAIKRHFQTDFKRISQSMRAARYAERIGKMEAGDLPVILIAAYLSYTGETAQPDADTAGASQSNQETIVCRVLTDLSAQPALIDQVLALLADPSEHVTDNNVNYRVLHDARRIVAIEDHDKESSLSQDELLAQIETDLFTQSAKDEALKLFGLEES